MNVYKVDMSKVPKGDFGKYEIPKGFRFNKLTVVEEVEPVKGKRCFELLCDCGGYKITLLTSLIEGRVTSCGCLQKQSRVETHTKHGMDGTRLNGCWKDMNKRAKNRDDCSVSPEWKDFSKFFEWSMENGYDEDKVLTRIRDKGDYTPSNCTWEDKSYNISEAHSCVWNIVKPCGEHLLVKNLNKWCEVNDETVSALSQISSGKYKGIKYKGWQVTKLHKVTEDEHRLNNEVNYEENVIRS